MRDLGLAQVVSDRINIFVAAAVLSILLIIGNVELNPGPGDTEGRVYSDEVFQREWINYMKETREDRLKASVLLNKVASDIDTLVNSCGNKNRNKEIETCGNRASSTPHINRRSASRNRKSRSVERINKNSNSSSGQKKSEITNRRIDELTGVNDIRAYLSKLENTVFTDPFRRKKSEEGQPSIEEDAGTSEDAVWGAEAQTERTTSEGRLRRASENSTRRSDCGSTGKVSDQFIRMPHAVGSPECARGSATVWRNCALPTDGVEEGDEQLLRGLLSLVQTVRVSVMDSNVASRLGAVVVMVFVHTERAALHAGSKEFEVLQTLWLDPSLEVGDAGAVRFVNIKYGSCINTYRLNRALYTAVSTILDHLARLSAITETWLILDNDQVTDAVHRHFPSINSVPSADEEIASDSFVNPQYDPNQLEMVELTDLPEISSFGDHINQEGLKYIAGYVAHRFRDKYSNVGSTTGNVTGKRPDWLSFISKETYCVQVKSFPEAQRRSSPVFSNFFIVFRKAGVERGPVCIPFIRLREEMIQEIPVVVADNAARNRLSSSSARAVSRQLNIPWSTVTKSLAQGLKICSVIGQRYCDVLGQQVIPALQERQRLSLTSDTKKALLMRQLGQEVME
ncbi:hypothetical protein ANN_21445 [Periplaneta americana]|uniref:Transposable element P transposase-like C-terminal domain-containing protein n=1 Tax=Periplaneta americana TaxID=6978 RepID=A0ABQ8SFA4_PERAM|nr:hypothetical protein ANN_21445 [Periplaneta americana]